METENHPSPLEKPAIAGSDHKKWLLKLCLWCIISGIFLATIKSINSENTDRQFFTDAIGQTIGFLLFSLIGAAFWEGILIAVRKRNWNMESFTANAIVVLALVLLLEIYQAFAKL